ncbi:AraC family transcriptional regulator [Lacinutrix venerupis]|nr:AraC family transcriptional regulator [Lacinutrix venerupis]
MINQKSIAVLPFVNMSNNIDNEYFCDGITEEIINALTSIQGLKVIARTSSFAFKNKNIDVRHIGNQLGVATVLEGSIRVFKKRIRITAQLINTTDGSHFWSNNFDRELSNIFELQDEISLLIADKIRENFGHFEVKEQLVEHPNISTQAYQEFLKAKKLTAQFNKQAILKGISILKNIIEAFPNFALAYINIHYAYNSMAAGGLMPVKDAFKKGENYLKKAHQLNVNLPEVYHSYGWNALNKKWDFKTASQHLQKALELKPGYSDAHQKLFITLILEGNLTDANYHIKKAYSLDPLNDLNNYFMAYNAYVNKDFSGINTYFNRCFEINNQFMVGYGIYALALSLQNKPLEIINVANNIPEIEGAKVERLIMTTIAYCLQQENDKIQANINALLLLMESESRERVSFFLIYIYTLIGSYTKALDIIETGILHKEPLMTLLKVDPLLLALQKFDRFNEYLQIIFERSNSHISKKEAIVKQLFSKAQEKQYKVLLIKVIEEEQLFLNSDLSLRILAQKIDINANQMSWLLNSSFKKNFNDFVNQYRINHFKTIALNPKFNHITILGLAYDSGFNSKSVFNTYFKKNEGITPSQWVKINKSSLL